MRWRWPIRRARPAVAAVAPEVQAFGQVVYQGNNVNTPIVGVTPDYGPVRNYTVQEGDFITQANVQAQVGRGRARRQRGQLSCSPTARTRSARSIRINNIPFRVVGVLAAKGGSGFGNQDDQVLVPITTAMARLQRGRCGGGNVVYADQRAGGRASRRWTRPSQQIGDILRQRHHILLRGRLHHPQPGRTCCRAPTRSPAC